MGNFRLAYPGEVYARQERRYYQFPYDWRYGTVETVKKLDALIEQIRTDYQDPTLKVDLVGHSMGGLIVRYYLRYGTADVLDGNDFPVTQAGAKKVRRVIQLGAPNLGSVASIHQLMNGYTTLVSKVNVEDLVTLPSIYQLLPHPLNDWLVTNEGKVLNRDLFDAELWKQFQWGVYDPKVKERVISSFDDRETGMKRLTLLQRYFQRHIERARRFVWSLTVPVPDVEYSVIAFGGNCVPTPARLLVEEIDGESMIRLFPDEVKNRVKGVDYERLILEPGDERVTKPSLLARNLLDPTRPRHEYSFFPLDYAFFLCHEHGQLTGNVSFQDNLLNALLEAE